MTGALRNLTNRMEELIGECTNLHITYPALVFGFLFVLRANREGMPSVKPNDVALGATGETVPSVRRFAQALRNIGGRQGIRNDVSRYEAVALALVEAEGATAGHILGARPEPDASLTYGGFFDTLYRRYEERFVFGAPDLASVTGRRVWSADSPAFTSEPARFDNLDFVPRR
jgi:hypothetical protein